MHEETANRVCCCEIINRFVYSWLACLPDSFHEMQEQENRHPMHILANGISCREMGRGQLEVDTTTENKYHSIKLERNLHRKQKSIEMGKTEGWMFPLKSSSHSQLPVTASISCSLQKFWICPSSLCLLLEMEAYFTNSSQSPISWSLMMYMCRKYWESMFWIMRKCNGFRAAMGYFYLDGVEWHKLETLYTSKEGNLPRGNLAHLPSTCHSIWNPLLAFSPSE